MTVSLSSLQLDAFFAVAKARSFSGAAKLLHVTQSALSQRVMNLESDLGASLVIRDPAGLRLTSAGEELLRYCSAKEGLEGDLLAKLSQSEGVGGYVRIAAFSSVTRSVVLPLVAEFIKKFPAVRVELFSKEIRDLLPTLSTNHADFIFTTLPTHRQEIESYDAGVEVNVLVRPRHGKYRESIFLDHDSDDTTTMEFLRVQRKSPAVVERNYLGEVYAIMDGVAAGLGQAVLPAHLVRTDRRLKIVQGLRPLSVPFYLQFYRQAFCSRLHKELLSFMLERFNHT